MKASSFTLTLIAAFLWISCITMLGIGFFKPELEILRFVAIPDGLAALVFTVLAIRS